MRLQQQRSLCLFRRCTLSTQITARTPPRIHAANRSSYHRPNSLEDRPDDFPTARYNKRAQQPRAPPGAGAWRPLIDSVQVKTMGQTTPNAFRHTFRLDLSDDQFKERLKTELSNMELELSEPELLESFELDQETFQSLWTSFEKHILSLRRASSGGRKEEWEALFHIYRKGRMKAVSERLRYAFYGHMVGSKFTKAELSNQKLLSDLRFPAEWFPGTRQIRRTIHLHVGPTNSGKTYHALQRLEQAESGVYAGPLRLLAHEIYTRLNAKGKLCGLVTGEERRIPEAPSRINMWSCTVEMTPLNLPLDVAVIDEIQMINNNERGWAWTQAFLGVQAREVHLCGEERTVPLIKELAASIGDRLVVHNYKRLSPLEMMDKSLKGDLNQLEKGDCVVSFSVMGIHALRKQIEEQTGRKVAIIYGSLPPETRAQQAKLFNDPDNDYDYLVASDAVGMGLNLSIKRVIFESASKHNGIGQAPLKIAEVKQIGGRAGRYRTVHQAMKEDLASRESVTSEGKTAPDEKKEQQQRIDAQGTVGYVTTLEDFDYPAVEYAMRAEAEPIKTAGIFPPSQIIERFSSYFPPGTPFSYVLLRLNEISRIHTRYHVCALNEQLKIADIIQPIKNLSISDRIILSAAPCTIRDPIQCEFIKEFAKRIGEQRVAPLLDIKQFNLELLDMPPTSQRQYLSSLESLHKGIVLYLWLSFRFPGVFTTRALANHTKGLVETAIEHTLEQFSFTKEKREELLIKRQQSLLKRLKRQYTGDLTEQDVRKGRREVQGGNTQDDEDAPEDVVEEYDVDKTEPEDNEPPDVKDIIMDEATFQENRPGVKDGYGEYSIPELESTEPKQHILTNQAP